MLRSLILSSSCIVFLLGCDSGKTTVIVDGGGDSALATDVLLPESCRNTATKPLFVRRYDVAGNVGGGVGLFIDNTGIVMVDDSCRFWVQTTTTFDRPWAELRTGQLSLQETVAVMNEVKVASWRSLPSIVPSPPSVFDAAPEVFSDGNVTVRCLQGCGWEGIDESVRDISARFAALRERLIGLGAPPDPGRPVRIRVDDLRNTTFGAPPSPLPWTLPIDIAALAIEPNDPRFNRVGQGSNVVDDSQKAALRALRDDYLGGRIAVSRSLALIPFGRGASDAGSVPLEFGVYIRDTFPFEDATGIVPVPW